MAERYLILLILSLVCNSFAFSQNWTGQVNSDWNNINNWSFPPSGNSMLIIDPVNYTGNATQPVVSSASNFIASELTIQNGADLTILNALNVTGNVTVKGAGTSLTVQGGLLQVTANGNLNITLGAEFIQNDGFVSVNQKLLIANGQSNNPSSYTLNSGNLVVNGSLSMESNIGNFSPVFNITAGTVTVSGEITWFGQAPGSGRPSFLVSGGTVNVNGNIKNLSGSTVDMRLQLKPFAVLNMNGSLLETIHATDSIITEKNSLFNFNQNCIINNSGVYHAKSGTAKFSSNTEIQGSGTYQFHHVTILASSTVNHISPQTISVSGNLYTPGTLIHNLNTLVINGTSMQNWNGSNGLFLNNLTMNNISPPNHYSGIWFHNPVTITGHLELTQGLIATSLSLSGPDNIITLIDGATSSLGSVESFVDGPMRKIGNDAFIFPIGAENHRGRLEISAPMSITSEFTAYYGNASFNNITDFDTPISAVSNSEFWYLRRENTVDPVEVKLHWDDAAYSHLVDCNELSMAKWSGNSWVNQPSTVAGDCTGNGTGTITADDLQSDFGYFTFAYLGNVTTQNTSICDGTTLVIGTGTYDTSGIYTHVYPAFAGGDSTVIINLSVLPPNDNTLFAELCFGESINWFGQSFDEAGVYTESYVSYLGCDSTVHLVVSIANEINVAVTQNGGTFSAQNTTADSYEWIDCQTNQPIQFTNSPTFTPTENGTYAVRIRKNNIGNVLITYCEAQSECFTINTVGLEEPTVDLFSIYPNPNSGSFKINWNIETPVESIEIYDLKGVSIFKQTEIKGHELTIDIGKVDAGIYILRVKAGSVLTYKVVKK